MADPAAEDLFDRYPELLSDNTDPEYVDQIIVEAAAEIGSSWITRDRPVAILALAAHRLMIVRLRSQISPLTGNVVAGLSSSETVGPLSSSYQQSQLTNNSPRAGSIEMAELAQTVYGTRYLELRHRSFPEVAIV